MKCRLGGSVALVILLVTMSVIGQGKHMQKLSVAGVLETLASKKAEAANDGIREVLRRGEKMIPSLLTKRGDRRFFYGTLPRNPNLATEFHSPAGDPRIDDPLLKRGKLVTVEVAAIYLICAIYYESMDIAGSPYLVDLSVPEGEQRAANTPEVVAKAWAGLDIWSDKFEDRGLQQMRAEKDAPLDKAGVTFW